MTMALYLDVCSELYKAVSVYFQNGANSQSMEVDVFSRRNAFCMASLVIFACAENLELQLSRW